MGRGSSSSATAEIGRRAPIASSYRVLAKKSDNADRVCEDAVFVDQHRGFAFVADGMGGMGHGAAAAEAAVAKASELCQQLPELGDVVARYRWLKAAIPSLSQAVRERMFDLKSDGGATAAFAVYSQDEANGGLVFTASVGDSRVYRFNAAARSLERLTVDDNVNGIAELEQELDEASSPDDLSPEARRQFKRRELVSQALGHFDPSVPVEVNAVQVHAGDLLILCSDGVHDNLTGSEVEEICRSTSAEDLAGQLVDAARARSEDDQHYRAKNDDISAAVLTVSG